ncbi:Uncharacterised protein [uncultured Clostridium sp.]|nr:Uncharacterised protein [uncultured Clostridium sp.]
MNYNMYTNRQKDQIDPNYIYPRPYIDPMMYVNPYMPYGPQFSNYQMEPTSNGYVTYANPFAENPGNPDLPQMDDNSVYPTIEDNDYNQSESFEPANQGYPNNQNPYSNQGYPNNQSPYNNQGYPNNQNPYNSQGYPNINTPSNMPGLPQNPNIQGLPMGYPPGMFPNMYMMPNMMYPPGMFPGMYMIPNMMYPPGMFPGMPQINMEEFDEEEM